MRRRLAVGRRRKRTIELVNVAGIAIPNQRASPHEKPLPSRSTCRAPVVAVPDERSMYGVRAASSVSSERGPRAHQVLDEAAVQVGNDDAQPRSCNQESAVQDQQPELWRQGPRDDDLEELPEPGEENTVDGDLARLRLGLGARGRGLGRCGFVLCLLPSSQQSVCARFGSAPTHALGALVPLVAPPRRQC